MRKFLLCEVAESTPLDIFADFCHRKEALFVSRPIKWEYFLVEKEKFLSPECNWNWHEVDKREIPFKRTKFTSFFVWRFCCSLPPLLSPIRTHSVLHSEITNVTSLSRVMLLIIWERISHLAGENYTTKLLPSERLNQPTLIRKTNHQLYPPQTLWSSDNQLEWCSICYSPVWLCDRLCDCDNLDDLCSRWCAEWRVVIQLICSKL